MAEIFVEKMGKEIAEKVLDEYKYKGKAIREWADLLNNGDAVEVVHGRWKKANNRPKSYIRVCSVCGKEAYFCGKGCSYKYCPNCGAKMRGYDDEQKG